MRHALVTGANRGLGLALVRALLARGDTVLACCRAPAAARELAALGVRVGARLQVLPLELTDAAAVAALPAAVAARVPRLELLIHNAGLLVSGERFGNVTATALGRSFAVNASAPLLLTQALAPLLERGAHARVLCVSSRLGSIAGADQFRTVSYAMSKAALNMAVKRLDAALRPRGILVLGADPGWLRTRLGGEDAPLSAAAGAALLLDLVQGAELADGGSFRASDGAPLLW